MNLIPSQSEVEEVLKETGALRKGHFAYPNGLHSNEYLQVPLALRYYQHQKMLSVGLSRLLRSHPEIRAVLDRLAIVTPATGGLPVAFGVCEALRAHQVYWAEREHEGEPLRFRQFVTPQPGQPVVIVDDILRTGSKLNEVRQLLEASGAKVLALAVVVHQPVPPVRDFGELPLYALARLEASYYAPGGECELCKQGLPVETVRV